METVIFMLVLAILSAVTNWLQKRAQEEQADSAEETPPPVSPPAGERRVGRQRDWEEEVRRLLGGETSLDRTSAPPVISTPQKRPPAAPQVPVPSRSSMPGMQEARRKLGEQARKLRDEVRERAQVDSSLSEQARRRTAEMKETVREEAAQRARELKDAVKDRARKTTGIDERRLRVHPVARPPDAAPVASQIARFRTPESLREAFVATLIFAAPRGLDERSGGPWENPS